MTGVMVMDCRIGWVTVSPAAGEVTKLKAAVMFVEPSASAEARPLVPDTLLIEATVGFDESQVAHVVRF